jgi:hypothetical protein
LPGYGGAVVDDVPLVMYWYIKILLNTKEFAVTTVLANHWVGNAGVTELMVALGAT